MNTPNQRLGPMETQLFSMAQLRRIEKVRTGDLVKSLGLSIKQERELLSRMTRSGLIIRLKRGLYLLPRGIPPGGKWKPNEYELIHQLMIEINAEYQITGPAAFNYHGLTQQIPNLITIYNDKVSGLRKVGGLKVSLVKVPKKRLGDFEFLSLPSGTRTKIGTLSRTLFDAVYEWSRFGTLPDAYVWINSMVKKNPGILNHLGHAVLKFGNVGTMRRLGYVLEKNSARTDILRKLEAKLPSSKGLIPFVPTVKARGKINHKWGIIINE
jgi:predicted transcriptional regulator of viral defense system